MGFVHTLLRWIFTSWKVNGGPPILDKGQNKGYTLHYAFTIILATKSIQKLYSSVPQSNCVPCWHQVGGCQVSHRYIKSKNKTKWHCGGIIHWVTYWCFTDRVRVKSAEVTFIVDGKSFQEIGLWGEEGDRCLHRAVLVWWTSSDQPCNSYTAEHFALLLTWQRAKILIWTSYINKKSSRENYFHGQMFSNTDEVKDDWK